MSSIDKSKGAVVMWRSILDSPIWENPELSRLYHWIMYRANWQPVEVFEGLEKIHLQPGQFVTSLKQVAKIINKRSVASAKKYLNVLKTENEIEIKSTNKYTVITASNWNDSQKFENKTENRVKTKEKQSETDNTLITNNTVVVSPEGSPLPGPRKTRLKQKPLPSGSLSPYKALILKFNKMYSTNLFPTFGKQAASIKRILQSYSEDEIWKCADWLNRDPYWKDKGFDFSIIQSQIAKWKMNQRKEVHGFINAKDVDATNY